MENETSDVDNYSDNSPTSHEWERYEEEIVYSE